MEGCDNSEVNDIQKSFIRRKYSPDVADICVSIDVHEKVEHFQRFVREYSEWLLNHQGIKMKVLHNLVCYRQY